MTHTEVTTDPRAVIDRIERAVNEHDLDALGNCFHPQYWSEQPFYPDRAFRGRKQMRKNWSYIFGAVPDIRAVVLRDAIDGDAIWTEWDLQGTQRDGTPWHSAMVTIGGVEDEQIVWMRLYMEQVREGNGIDASVRTSFARPTEGEDPREQGGRS
jgi:ketosteroid isomerase-like protein